VAALSFKVISAFRAFAGSPLMGIDVIFWRYWLLVQIRCVIVLVLRMFANPAGMNLPWLLVSMVLAALMKNSQRRGALPTLHLIPITSVITQTLLVVWMPIEVLKFLK